MDKGRELADKELQKLERRLNKEYRTAQKEMKAKYNKFTKDFAEKDKKQRELVTKGLLEQKEYKAWRENQMLRSKWFKDMTETLAKDQTNINQRATKLINSSMAGAYAEAFNYGTYSVEKAIGVDTAFTLYNKSAVERLAKDNPKLLPKAKVNVTKDQKWNQRKMNSAITQGILQGESIDKIAGRLGRVTDMNASAAIRNARTMMTSAENEARLDSFERAADMGVEMQKCWIATLDDRVRESHAELDGECVPLDEPFSNGLMYPADPDGEPAEVYNCRCTMISQIKGFERDVTDLDLRPAEIGSYDEWKAAHTGKGGGDDFASKIAGIVAAKGVTEESIKECGRIFADEMDKEYKAVSNDIAKAQAKVDELMKPFAAYENEYNKLWNGLYEDPAFKSLGLSWEEGKSRYDELAGMRRKITRSEEYEKARRALSAAKKAARDPEVMSDMLAKKLSEIRPVGSQGLNVKAHLCNSSSKVLKNVEFAYERYPHAWVKESIATGSLTPRKVERGYYSHYRKVIAISGDGASATRTAFHELGHRFEQTHAGIKEAEKTFYERRTKGETLEWLGSGYDKGEKTRKDKFINAYMGKDYGGYAYELVSMGFEKAYTDPFSLAKDPEMQQWIYGLLAIG